MADSQYWYPKPSQFPPNLTREPPNSPVELKGGGPNKPTRKAKSFTDFLCKFLFFALFLVAIPLFPSQAPGFISQSVLTKFWELFHLLFIGVAVSYGLFCRRNVDVDIETHTTNDDDSESYVSRVFHVSSIFEDGFDSSCGYGEKNVYQTLYSENYKANESLADTSLGNSVMCEQTKIESLNSEIGFEYSCGYVNQAWNSQYFQGESMVVVPQPDCSINQNGQSGSMMGHKSLNLPIRSLRSGDRYQDSPEISDESVSSSPSKDSSNIPYVSISNELGDLGATNLENRFNETDSFSPIPWRSRSERMEFGENMGATAASRSHFRPLSVDESQFESLKLNSLWSTESFSSQASSAFDSPNGLSPSHVASSELENLRMEELGKAKMEELEKGKGFRRSYPPDFKSGNKKTALNAFHLRRYSTNGSLFEKNARKSFEDDLRDLSKSKRENPLSSDVGRSGASNFDGNLGNLVKASLRDMSKSKREDPLSSDVGGRTVSSKFDGNPGNFVKTSPTGRSVRTIRSRQYAAQVMKNEERGGNHYSNKLDQKAINEVEEAMYKRKYELKNGGSNNLLSTGAKKHDLDAHCHVDKPKATISELHKRKNRELSENLAMESKEKPARETQNLQVSWEKESVTDSVSDAGTNTNEVDKKASEFIAKFREQIKLQKMASIDRSRRP